MTPTDPWFANPLDSMPIATDDNKYASRHESSPDFEQSRVE